MLFTPRQKEIIQLAKKGLTTREIASIVLVTEATVKFHLGRIFKRAQVRNKTELAAWAHKHYKLVS